MCNRSHSIEYEYWLLKKYLYSQAGAEGILLGQVSHFVTHCHLKEKCCESFYVSSCHTVTAFSANSCCRDCQLSWLRYTGDFKIVATWFLPFQYKSTHTTCMDSSAQMHVENPHSYRSDNTLISRNFLSSFT